ncbi:hypothetical protein BHM03_00003370 [Ensete ventricosum]|nr:hypothetical protein BHM03_00003370 [Ensete ventricosum]
MTTKHKSPTSRSSIHSRLDKVIGGRQSIVGSKHNSLYHFRQKFTLSHETKVQKDIMSNKIGIYHKHIRNNGIYIC